MGITKTSLFNDQQNRLAEYFKVLGHPARIAILQYLIESNTCINGDLVKELGLAQPTVSQHLKELKRLGIIKGQVDGPAMCYCIHKENWEKVNQEVLGLFLRVTEKCC